MRSLVFIARASFLVAIAASAGACGSSTQNVTGPTAVKCAVTANANPSTFSATGGSGTLAVTTNRECQWTASPSTAWISLGTSAGQGEASVAFTVASNADPSARNAAISVGDQQVSIAQEAAPCVYGVSPANDTIEAAGGRKTIAVTASSSKCTWTARSDVDWIAIVEGSQGTGNGQVTYEARTTTGPTRSGTLLVAGQVVTIAQGQGCSYAIDPVSQAIPASGGTGGVNVHTAPGCPWIATSNAAWVTITAGANGSGEGRVQFSTAASTGPARAGTLTVAGFTFTINQASGCAYTLAPSSQNIGDAGGSGSFTVNTPGGCDWSASSNAPWIAITGATGGSGTGTVTFQVAANAMGGAPRTGTIAVNGQVFTVNQAAGVPCAYALAPTMQDVPATAGTGSFAVSTVATCPWTAVSNAGWISIIGPPGGAGNGTVNFSFAENPIGSGPRSGTISVNGQTFTVNQAAGAACTYTLAPASLDVSPAAGTGSFSVTVNGSCSWTATSNAPWITITSAPGGTGNGAVSFSWSENAPGSPARTGTISVNGQTFTLNQAAPGQ